MRPVIPRESVVAAVCLAAVLAGCNQPPVSVTINDQLHVTHVADGDTITVADASGHTTRVRLLSIDAPEVAHDGQSAECGADAARDALQALVLHQDVTLVEDRRADPVDRYGRRLVYVDVHGVDAGRRQIDEGYAEAWYPRREPRPERHPNYEQAQRAAQQSHTGAWAYCPSMGR